MSQLNELPNEVHARVESAMSRSASDPHLGGVLITERADQSYDVENSSTVPSGEYRFREAQPAQRMPGDLIRMNLAWLKRYTNAPMAGGFRKVTPDSRNRFVGA